MTDAELKVLLEAASMLKISASDLKPVNPFTQQGGRAELIQTAVASINPSQAARWRQEAGESASLEAAAVRAGLKEMSQAVHQELMQIDPDFITGQEEAKAAWEAKMLHDLEKGAERLAENRDKQQAAFQRQAGSNKAGGQYTREFTQRMEASRH